MMATNNISETDSDLPKELAKPASRALLGAGYLRLEQLTKLSESEILKLHGMGPRAMDQLRRALIRQRTIVRRGIIILQFGPAVVCEGC
jgi:predicted Fe-Mo cluster-binding NifX family protein